MGGFIPLKAGRSMRPLRSVRSIKLLKREVLGPLYWFFRCGCIHSPKGWPIGTSFHGEGEVFKK